MIDLDDVEDGEADGEGEDDDSAAVVFPFRAEEPPAARQVTSSGEREAESRV